MANTYLGGDLFESVVTKSQNAFDKANNGVNAILGGTVEVDERIDGGTSGQATVELVYPSDIVSTENHPNIFMFRAYDMSSTTRSYYGEMRTNFTSTSNNKSTGTNNGLGNHSKLLSTISLYAPNLVEEISHEFNKYATSVFADFAAKAFSAGSEAMQGNFAEAGSTLKSGAMEGIGGTVAQYQRGLLAGTKAGSLAKNSTVVTDNVSVTAFKGTNLRTQSFTYIFTPKSLDELKQVGAIIKTFYSLSLPEKTSFSNVVTDATSNASFRGGFEKFATAYKTPPVWMIEEVTQNESTRYTPRFIFGPAGITSVRLNKTPDQYWRTLQGTGGDSASIEMEITFTELLPMTRQIYDNDLGSSINGYDSAGSR